MPIRFVLLNCLVLLLPVTFGSKVLELSDRFIEVRENGLWLVKFYAPWCGHCKRLEATWNLVSQDLHYTDVRVGRIDCTRFTNVASEFDIRGFPTILFFKGPRIFTYTGDRTREDIVQFAQRLEGPPVRQLEGLDELNLKKTNHEVFFLFYAATLNDASLLRNAFNYVADEFQTTNYFYSLIADTIPEKIPDSLLDGHTNVKNNVLVFKDDRIYNFKTTIGNQQELNSSLLQWVERERFAQFSKITQSTFSLMLRTGKYLVMAVLEENLIEKLTPEMEEFRRIIKTVANDRLEDFKNDFLFGWAPQTSIASSIAMQRMEAPCLLVVNSQTYQYYMPNVQPSDTTPDIVINFLRGILSNTERARGGNGLLSRIYRIYFDVTTTLIDMWIGNPVLTSVLFGLPLGFLSLICYSICCADILDANEEDEDGEEDAHEKKE